LYENGEINRQNTRYWSQQNPHWYTDSKEQGAMRLMVRCGTWNVEHLLQRIIEACNAITPGIIKHVFVDWVKRLNMCIENNGGQIEQVL
jgi:hypothetical protein